MVVDVSLGNFRIIGPKFMHKAVFLEIHSLPKCAEVLEPVDSLLKGNCSKIL